MVLLKYFDATGFVFYTNLESRKAREMANNSRVALLFYWGEVSRQVRITGTATRGSTAESRCDDSDRKRCHGRQMREEDTHGNDRERTKPVDIWKILPVGVG